MERRLNILVILGDGGFFVVNLGQVKTSLSEKVVIVFVDGLINHLEELDFFGQIIEISCRKKSGVKFLNLL